MTQMTDEQIKAALNGQTQEEQKVTTTIDVSADGNVQGVTEGFQHTFTTNKDALPTLDVLDEMGLVDGTDYTYDSRSKTLVLAVTQEQLDEVQHRTRVRERSGRIVTRANAITAVASNVLDYGLHAGLVPVAGSVANATLTTGRVVVGAGLKMGAAVAASGIRNGRKLATEVYHSPEIRDCANEVGSALSDLGNFFFGKSSGANGWQRVSA